MTLCEKWPRQYAADIIRLPKDRRRAALSEVPEHLREWVREYLNMLVDRNRRKKSI